MKYHKEYTQRVYPFKGAQKCYAKLVNPFDSVENWLINSKLFVSDTNDINRGAVHSFFDESKKKYGFMYPEITGYYASTMAFLFSINEDSKYVERAEISSNWLINIFEKFGGIVQGVDTNLSKLKISYSFDTAICAKGLLDTYRITNNRKYLDWAKNWLEVLSKKALEDDGTVKPLRNLEADTYFEKDDVWYNRKGCFHVKIALPFAQLYQITHEPKLLQKAELICKSISKFQQSDGSILLHTNLNQINLHTLCYSLEGLLFSFNVTKNESYLSSCKQAVDWCSKQIADDGSINLWHNSKYKSKAVYPIAQLIRIMILLDNFSQTSNYKKHIDKLYNFLLSMQSTINNIDSNGGFYEEFYKSVFGWKKRYRLNSWTSMFALQAIYWYQNYDRVSFNKQINFLY